MIEEGTPLVAVMEFHDVVTSHGTGVVSGLIGAAVWIVLVAVIFNVLSSSYGAVVVIFIDRAS
jgi:hypothetical protein